VAEWVGSGERWGACSAEMRNELGSKFDEMAADGKPIYAVFVRAAGPNQVRRLPSERFSRVPSAPLYSPTSLSEALSAKLCWVTGSPQTPSFRELYAELGKVVSFRREARDERRWFHVTSPNADG
jgi:hypothetical protein